MAAELHLSNGQSIVLRDQNPRGAEQLLTTARDNGSFLRLHDESTGVVRVVNPDQVAQIIAIPDIAEGGFTLQR